MGQWRWACWALRGLVLSSAILGGVGKPRANGPANDGEAPPLEELVEDARSELTRAKELSAESMDAAWSLEDCAPLFAASSRLHLPITRHLGLTNMMLQLTDAIARACNDEANVGFGAFWTTSGKASATLDPSELFDVHAMNRDLAATHHCNRTRVVPRQCLAYVSVETDQSLLTGAVVAQVDTAGRTRRGMVDGADDDGLAKGAASAPRMLEVLRVPFGNMFGMEGRLNLANHLMAYVQLRDRVAWSAWDPRFETRVELRAGEYDAVHLNLDVDWVVYRATKAPELSWHHFFYGNVHRQKAIAQQCCDLEKGRPEIIARIREVINEFAKEATRCFVPGRPVVIATSIGKSKYSEVTHWILEEFIEANPQLTFVVGRTNSTEITVNAAAEGRVLEGAGTFIAAGGSTFSTWMRKRIELRGGRTSAVDF